MAMIEEFRKRLFAYMFFSSFMPILALYAIMFSDRSGLSTQEISWIFVIWSITLIATEIPSGFFADYFSRKLSIVLYQVLLGLCFLVWYLFDSFFGCALGVVLWGTGWSLQSGALTAYVYEHMQSINETEGFTKIFTRMEGFSIIGVMASYALAYYLVPYGYNVIMLASIGFVCISILAASTLPPDAKRVVLSFRQQIDLTKSGVLVISHSRTMTFYVASLAVIGGLVITVDKFIPLYYSSIGLSTQLVPLVLGLGMAVASVLAWNAHKLKNNLTLAVGLLYLLGASILFVGSLGGMLSALCGMFIFMRIIKIAKLVLEESFQHQILSGDVRATLTSVPSFIAYFFVILFSLIYGVAAKLGSQIWSVRVVAIMLILWAIYYLIRSRQLRILNW